MPFVFAAGIPAACRLFMSIIITKIMQGECNGNTGKRSFTSLDTAEPKLIFYKDNANEWKESLLLLSRVQLILYKDKKKAYKLYILPI